VRNRWVDMVDGCLKEETAIAKRALGTEVPSLTAEDWRETKTAKTLLLSGSSTDWGGSSTRGFASKRSSVSSSVATKAKTVTITKTVAKTKTKTVLVVSVSTDWGSNGARGSNTTMGSEWGSNAISVTSWVSVSVSAAMETVSVSVSGGKRISVTVSTAVASVKTSTVASVKTSTVATETKSVSEATVVWGVVLLGLDSLLLGTSGLGSLLLGTSLSSAVLSGSGLRTLASLASLSTTVSESSVEIAGSLFSSSRGVFRGSEELRTVVVVTSGLLGISMGVTTSVSHRSLGSLSSLSSLHMSSGSLSSVGGISETSLSEVGTSGSSSVQTPELGVGGSKNSAQNDGCVHFP